MIKLDLNEDNLIERLDNLTETKIKPDKEDMRPKQYDDYYSEGFNNESFIYDDQM